MGSQREEPRSSKPLAASNTIPLELLEFAVSLYQGRSPEPEENTEVCGVNKVKRDCEDLGKTVRCEATHDAVSTSEAVRVSASNDL